MVSFGILIYLYCRGFNRQEPFEDLICFKQRPVSQKYHEDIWWLLSEDKYKDRLYKIHR